MLLIPCPVCGPRPEIEFRYGGQAHVPRPDASEPLSDAVVAERLYMRDNVKGIRAERWRHIHGCGRFFTCARDTVSDAFTTPGGERP
jgi:sarcosine oxidase subunit delta